MVFMQFPYLKSCIIQKIVVPLHAKSDVVRRTHVLVLNHVISNKLKNTEKELPMKKNN